MSRYDEYIPDLTERYPEGLRGRDMFEPYDVEAEIWAEMEREYRKEQEREIERITRNGYSIIKQCDDGWTFAENNNELFLCIIKGGKITRIDDIARNTPENRASMLETWEELA